MNWRQLTTCTKARANRHLRCKCAIFPEVCFSKFKWSSSFAVRHSGARQIGHWRMLSQWRGNLSNIFHHSEVCYPFRVSWDLLVVLSFVLSPLIDTRLVWVLVRKGAEQFYTLWSARHRQRGGAVPDLRGVDLHPDTRGLLGDLENTRYIWTKFFGICIRSWYTQIRLSSLHNSWSARKKSKLMQVIGLDCYK